ncbi:MAG: two-component system, OmpR family, phosphate regulon sensor histidine kinase PhoR [Thermoanaerobaculia bacterium]|jgi:signal transduction histidine kinase|nr:two-component system, OmpR family, phosphate regulon sensor histidine kinase PhoR [Thermoanaerobaculia bacterium]
MKGSRSGVAALISLAVLAAALIVLGTLQYRWIGEMADAERQRMRAGIDFAAHHFSDDFDHELTRAFFAFQMPMVEARPEHLFRRYDEWAASTRDTRIVKAIYFVPPNDADHPLLVEPLSHHVVPAQWQLSLLGVRSMIAESFASGHPVPPIVPQASALIVPCGELPRIKMERIHAQMMMMHGGGPGPTGLHGGDPGPPTPSYTIIQLDRDYITRVMLPDLTRRYFDTPAGRQYDVAIIATDNGEVLYRSDEGTSPFRSDLVVPVFSVRVFRREPFDGAVLREPALHPPEWHLLVRHHAGTLEEIVGATRRRNLMLTGGILAVLAGTMIALVAMLRSAERLRLQQLEFVAGVTHELNTPVAALTAAGQNLADGIITEPSQVARYGSAIVKESRRLTEMIGQVLAYGGMQSRRRLPLAPVDVSGVVDEAVAACRWMAEEQGVVVETHVDRGLPLVGGDAASLARAVQNLLGNAIRHGADGKWVAISAAAIDSSVVIRVEDHGPGIAARDLPHLFEPFFRGHDARVRGSGLGLTIVKQIASVHGGSVTADRRRERGAAFTLRLPARAEAGGAPEIAQHA